MLLRFGEKKICSKSADVRDLVIFRDVSLKISNKNEHNSILTKFHDFMISFTPLLRSTPPTPKLRPTPKCYGPTLPTPPTNPRIRDTHATHTI